MSVLVTGGAGYIGAHMLLALDATGEKTVAVDNLSAGSKQNCPDNIPFIEADVGNQALMADIIERHNIEEIIHFAGTILVSQSLSDPLTYYRNNTMTTLNLIETAVKCGVKRFIFSSTAAVYGTPERIPIAETATIKSLTPYGASMSMSERILDDTARAYGLPHINLRYFNVAGADPQMRAGEVGKPNHLIKVAAQIAVGTRHEALQIYGTDYPTPDGTAVRDYVHVSDLVDAHLAALEYLRGSGATATLNCGYGRGYSVYEVIDAVERVTGKTIPTQVADRRPGDSPQLVADSAAIRTTLDWRPHYDDLDFIISTAIDWENFLATKDTALTATSQK